jgi:hypothetical protein
MIPQQQLGQGGTLSKGCERMNKGVAERKAEAEAEKG